MCISPQTNQQGNTYACGRCDRCHKKYIQHWIFRLQRELHHWQYVLFITLTYDYEHLPFCRGKQTLDKTHLQLFMKILRKKLKRTLKYVVCGEYGSIYDRPHYHMLLFNVTDDDFNDIQKAWHYGGIHIGAIEPASIAYTFKYAVKEDLKIRDSRQQKPFVHMSKGLGETFAFDISYKKFTGVDKNGKKFVRYSKIRISKPHFQAKLDTLLDMPFYVLPSAKGGTVKMSVPRFFLRAANYDSSELGEIFAQKVAQKYHHLPDALRDIAIAREMRQKGHDNRTILSITTAQRKYAISKESSFRKKSVNEMLNTKK